MVSKNDFDMQGPRQFHARAETMPKARVIFEINLKSFFPHSQASPGRPQEGQGNISKLHVLPSEQPGDGGPDDEPTYTEATREDAMEGVLEKLHCSTSDTDCVMGNHRR